MLIASPPPRFRLALLSSLSLSLFPYLPLRTLAMYALATSLHSLSGAFSARSTSSTSSLSCGRAASGISTASSDPGMGTSSDLSAEWTPLALTVVVMSCVIF